MAITATARGLALNTPRLGRAWLTLAAALALHVLDEALTGFLNVWNPTVTAMHARWSWIPLQPFPFASWLGGLLILVVLLFALSPVFFRGGGVVRVPAYAFAMLMIANGVGHIAGTVAGQTVPEVTFTRPAPGFYSSPLLIAAAAWVLVELRRSRKKIV